MNLEIILDHRTIDAALTVCSSERGSFLHYFLDSVLDPGVGQVEEEEEWRGEVAGEDTQAALLWSRENKMYRQEVENYIDTSLIRGVQLWEVLLVPVKINAEENILLLFSAPKYQWRHYRVSSGRAVREARS